MKTTKHFALVALLVMGVTLSASTPVLAQSTITLTNVAGRNDRDSGASGQATLTDVAYAFSDVAGGGGVFFHYDFYAGYLTMSCSGLTPGATYRIGPTSDTTYGTYYSYVTASDTGTVDLALQVWFAGAVSEYEYFGDYEQYLGTWHPDFSLSVARKRGSKYITVLHGSLPYPY